MLPEAGQIVRVRSRQYLVEEVVEPPQAGQDTLVRLSCLEDDAQGTEIQVLWEREVDCQVRSESSWKEIAKRGFDRPSLFAAYLNALRWNCVTATEPKLFQAPYRAGIQIHAYQLEPLRKALLLPRVNLFIADDVGLGKTIEAGLILREMILRQKVREVVVACPPSVVLQWKDELESRFGLTFVVFDRKFVLARRRERGYSVNPWKTHTRFIVSHSLLRDEAYAGPLRDALGDFKSGSLLILDEAHNAAPATGSRYAIDSEFTKTVRQIAPRFEHRLFLSATPHNGHSNSFAALLEILDPQRFCRGVAVRGQVHLDAVMVRRLKEDLREIEGGFPKRIPVQVDIAGLSADAPELLLSRLLDEYAELRERRLADATRSQQVASALVLSSLQKRLLSSFEAFHRTLRVHRRTVERQAREAETQRPGPSPDPRQLTLLEEAPGGDDDRAEVPEDQVQDEEDAQMEAATAATLSRGKGPASLLTRELDIVERMFKAADEARGVPDRRIVWIANWARENLCPRGRWNDRRLLIFTEYADTKRYLDQQLRAAIVGTDRADQRIRTFHGGMDEESREEVKRAFNSDPREHPLRILIATDAAREGVNLQNHCADLIHFDLPWNPSRLEQRNGRIDRKLQSAAEVRCCYFYYPQRAEDRVLQALVKKTETIRRELGSLSHVLERRVSRALSGGIRHRETVRIVKAIEDESLSAEARATVEEELESARERRTELKGEIQVLQGMLKSAEEHIGFDEDHFRDAINQSLGMLGSEGLQPLESHEMWTFPALDQRPGADPTWMETLDTLRVPRRRDEKPWEWRKTAPLRTIVFKAPQRMDEGLVHLHLEHRLAQRLLGRFLAQGFIHEDLSRACVSLTKDPLPRVVLFGRLSLYGPGAARLHDEVVAVAARWIDPEVRKGALRPFAAEDRSSTLDLLAVSLGKPSIHRVPKEALKGLASSVERDVRELGEVFSRQGETVAERAIEKLRSRGEKEARDMAKILDAQRERIDKTISKTDQQTLIAFKDYDADEKRQLDADRKHWRKRLAALAKEREEEPARIRLAYEVKARRAEIVGIAYLWPESG